MSAWLTIHEANHIAGVMGGLIGALAGGVGGPMMGILAPKGKAKGLVVGFQLFWIAVGVGLLITGVVALMLGQPGYVGHPFLLVGFITTAVVGGLFPVTLLRYREAEKRKLDAEEFRRG
jgi:hypothetical protein